MHVCEWWQARHSARAGNDAVRRPPPQLKPRPTSTPKLLHGKRLRTTEINLNTYYTNFQQSWGTVGQPNLQLHIQILFIVHSQTLSGYSQRKIVLCYFNAICQLENKLILLQTEIEKMLVYSATEVSGAV